MCILACDDEKRRKQLMQRTMREQKAIVSRQRKEAIAAMDSQAKLAYIWKPLCQLV